MYIRITNKLIFDKIRNKDYSLKNLQTDFITFFNGVPKSEINVVVKLEAQLLYFYNVTKEENPRDNIIEEKGPTYQEAFLLSSRIQGENNQPFHYHLSTLLNGDDRHFKITYLLDRIDLLNSLKT